jgi:MFS family permease
VPFVSVGILAIINGLLAMRLLPRALKDGSIEYKRRDVQLSVVQRLKLSLFNRMIAPLLLGTFIIALVDSSISVTLAYFITGPLQSTQTMAGWAFTTNAGVSVLAQILMFSRVFQRLGDTLTIVVGFSFSAVGYFLLGTSKYLVMVFCGLGLVSFGRGFARPAVSTGISLRSPKELQGSSFGVQSTISSFGRTIGPLIAGWLFGHYERDPYYFSAGLLLLTIGFYLVWMSRMRKTVRSASQTDDVRETIS